MRQLLPFLKTLTNGHELDEAITDWIEQCWKEGETLGLINDALCGLHHFAPWTKKQIPQSWKLFAVWRKLEGPSRALPITANIVYCLANYALEHCDIIFAGMLLIGFFGLLRTGELLNVRACDLLADKKNLLISLPNTKSGTRHSAAEMVQVSDPFTLEVIREVKAYRVDNNCLKVPLWDFTPQSFRDRFAYHLRKFDLVSHGFRPYSLRRGGATHLFQVSGSMELALLKGRWSSPKVAKIYISDALSFLPAMEYSDLSRRMLQKWNPLFNTWRCQVKGSWKEWLKGRFLLLEISCHGKTNEKSSCHGGIWFQVNSKEYNKGDSGWQMAPLSAKPCVMRRKKRLCFWSLGILIEC